MVLRHIGYHGFDHYLLLISAAASLMLLTTGCLRLLSRGAKFALDLSGSNLDIILQQNGHVENVGKRRSF
jgi:hypothetical protein